MKLLPGQGLTLTTLGVWGRAAMSGGIAAGADVVGCGLAEGEGFAAGEPEGAGDPAGLDPGLDPGLAAALAAGLAGVLLAPALDDGVAAAEGAADAATGGVAGTGGYVNPPPPPFVQPASRATTMPAAASRPSACVGSNRSLRFGCIVTDGTFRPIAGIGRITGRSRRPDRALGPGRIDAALAA